MTSQHPRREPHRKTPLDIPKSCSHTLSFLRCLWVQTRTLIRYWETRVRWSASFEEFLDVSDFHSEKTSHLHPRNSLKKKLLLQDDLEILWLNNEDNICVASIFDDTCSWIFLGINSPIYLAYISGGHNAPSQIFRPFFESAFPCFRNSWHVFQPHFRVGGLVYLGLWILGIKNIQRMQPPKNIAKVETTSRTYPYHPCIHLPWISTKCR